MRWLVKEVFTTASYFLKHTGWSRVKQWTFYYSDGTVETVTIRIKKQ